MSDSNVSPHDERVKSAQSRIQRMDFAQNLSLAIICSGGAWAAFVTGLLLSAAKAPNAYEAVLVCASLMFLLMYGFHKSLSRAVKILFPD